VNYDVGSEFFCFFFSIPVMVSFMTVLQEILQEKQKSLRQALNLYGVHSGHYWASWIISAVI
jgi:hypothetical protein